ncbi:uncharacterized protein N7483_005217 [Penicillium malachiteum]|uniref:uncharacterized protein n=1 Tax=Penicillium malachiteum TaxID=1324776 RepID=UPI002548D748|nr:uncharacterized protein N7483_005217 [Penicillium malachiteum]KAJ5730709.1 hypothetical protein N7483_005217 [Penicillium malachiteum]
MIKLPDPTAAPSLPKICECPCDFIFIRATSDYIQREVSALEAKLDRMVELLAASEKSAKDLQSNTSHSPEPSPPMHENQPATRLSDHEGDALLEIFRTRMVPLFPFIVVPAHITAAQLRREKPFLYLNITMIACQDGNRQRAMVKIVKQYISEHIVAYGEHSLDILQGLLAHVAWFISVPRLPEGHPAEMPCNWQENIDLGPRAHVQISAQMDVFLQLAIGQLISLNLNQGIAALKNLDRPLSYVRATDFQPNQIPARTLEERRAYLGCYYLSVMLTTCMRDMEPVRFTKYTQECCQELVRVNELVQVNEVPTDSYLVQLVRVMHLANRIHRGVSFDEIDSPNLSAPLVLAIRSHQAELDHLKNEHFSDLSYGDHQTTRLDLLYRCLEATKSFFLEFHSLPLGYLLFFPLTFLGQFGQAMVTLSRLTLFQGDNIGWDRAYVQSILDFDKVADKMLQRLQDARDLFNQEKQALQLCVEQPEVIQRLSARMEIMKEVHRKRRKALEKTNLQAPPELLDLSYITNMPFDIFFPYGNYGEIPTNLALSEYF